MKKISLIATLLLAVLLLQNCKRDTISATATSNNLFFATINDTTWTADTLSASVTYNSATKSKIFACSAIAVNKEVNMSVAQTAGNNTGFPLGTYNVDATTNVVFSYDTKQKNSSGNFVFAPLGTVGPGSGTVTVSAVDSVNKLITGTFGFTAIRNNYDNNGNIISVTLSQVQGGAFNNLPYSFKSN